MLDDRFGGKILPKRYLIKTILRGNSSLLPPVILPPLELSKRLGQLRNRVEGSDPEQILLRCTDSSNDKRLGYLHSRIFRLLVNLGQLSGVYPDSFGLQTNINFPENRLEI